MKCTSLCWCMNHSPQNSCQSFLLLQKLRTFLSLFNAAVLSHFSYDAKVQLERLAILLSLCIKSALRRAQDTTENSECNARSSWELSSPRWLSPSPPAAGSSLFHASALCTYYNYRTHARVGGSDARFAVWDSKTLVGAKASPKTKSLA